MCAHTVNSGFVSCWETVILVSSTKIATLSHRRVIFDRCISDTLGTAVKIGTWWNSTNTGSGHSWKESVALVWLLFSNHLDLSTPKLLGVCVACATRPLPNQDTPIFQELVPLFPCSVGLPPLSPQATAIVLNVSVQRLDNIFQRNKPPRSTNHWPGRKTNFPQGPALG